MTDTTMNPGDETTEEEKTPEVDAPAEETAAPAAE